jgi:hypothetical protein
MFRRRDGKPAFTNRDPYIGQVALPKRYFLLGDESLTYWSEDSEPDGVQRILSLERIEKLFISSTGSYQDRKLLSVRM